MEIINVSVSINKWIISYTCMYVIKLILSARVNFKQNCHGFYISVNINKQFKHISDISFELYFTLITLS